MSSTLISSDLLFTRASGTQSFNHDTYNDYFAAMHMAENCIKPPSDITPSLAVFYCGLSNESLSFIKNHHLSIDTAALCYHESTKKDPELEQLLVNTAIKSLHDTGLEKIDRLKSVQALKLLQSEYFLSICEPLFMHEVRYIRDETVSIITTYRYNQVKDLFDSWSHDSNWMIRWNIIDCLAQYHNSDAIHRVLGMTSDSEPLVSYKALLGLRRMISSQDVTDTLSVVKSKLPMPEHRFIDSLFLAPETSLKPKKNIDYTALEEKLRDELEQNPEMLHVRVRLYLVLNAIEDYASMEDLTESTRSYVSSQVQTVGRNLKIDFLAGFIHHLSQPLYVLKIYRELLSDSSSPKLTTADTRLINKEYDESKIHLTEFLNNAYGIFSKGEEFIYGHINGSK